MADVYDSIKARQFFDFNDFDDEETDVFFDVRETPNPKQSSNHNRKSQRCSSQDNINRLAKPKKYFGSTGNLSRAEPAHKLQDNIDLLAKPKKYFGSTGNLSQAEAAHKFQDNINRLAKPKKYFRSTDNLSQQEYIPIAEAVRKFQKSTPERFRLKSQFNAQQPALKMELTHPKTPHLMTKGRARLDNELLTREEKEWLEFQQEQKFKIKAHPLNKKILQGPLKSVVAVEKKSVTVPEPFVLTEVQHKVADEPKINNEFHARPVPKAVYEPCQIKAQKVAPTVPKTPSFMKNVKAISRIPNEKEQKEQPPTKYCPKVTKLEPFSFEIMNQYRKNKKEEAIKRILEEEKKAREFHAKPIPKNVLQTCKETSNSNNSSQKSLKRTESHENLGKVQFKARPATVLQKKPFIPARSEKPLTEITALKLNTDLRAEEREEFDHQLKEKEKELARLREQEELRIKQQEEEEARRLRKLAEHKAQPIRKYKEVQIKPSGKVTTPQSPNIGRKHSSQE